MVIGRNNETNGRFWVIQWKMAHFGENIIQNVVTWRELWMKRRKKREYNGTFVM